MFVSNISHDVGAIEMTLGAAQSELRSAAAKLARDVNPRSIGNAVHRVFVVSD